MRSVCCLFTEMLMLCVLVQTEHNMSVKRHLLLYDKPMGLPNKYTPVGCLPFQNVNKSLVVFVQKLMLAHGASCSCLCGKEARGL